MVRDPPARFVARAQSHAAPRHRASRYSNNALARIAEAVARLTSARSDESTRSTGGRSGGAASFHDGAVVWLNNDASRTDPDAVDARDEPARLPGFFTLPDAVHCAGRVRGSANASRSSSGTAFWANARRSDFGSSRRGGASQPKIWRFGTVGGSMFVEAVLLLGHRAARLRRGDAAMLVAPARTGSHASREKPSRLALRGLVVALVSAWVDVLQTVFSGPPRAARPCADTPSGTARCFGRGEKDTSLRRRAALVAGALLGTRRQAQ
mmetsp:Transcript_6450/g.20307  ORF Transcript_6450/g.20307 Transcript_6450/m.20307 type:complete len:267 (-) Transcript_6450:1361-2161(-)